MTTKNEKGIYKMSLYCGRMGDLNGIFIAKKEDVKNLIGKEVYFGEVLGKHSEVVWNFEEKDLEFVTDDEKVIELFEKHNLTSGYNPFDYETLGELMNEEENEEDI